MKSARDKIDFVNSLPIAAYIATTNGSTADLAGYNGVLVTINIGTVTDGTHVFKLQDSTNNSTWTDVAAAKMEKSFVTVDSTKSNSIQRVGYQGTNRRFLRVVTTVTGATTGGFYCANIIRAFPNRVPLA